jgi:homocysteine S-methyltransferase
MLETMSNIAEASAGARALHEQNVVGVIGFTVDDDDGTKLRSGESLAEAVASVLKYQPDAILINCSRPEAVTAGLDIIKQSGIRFGAYANGFTAVEALRPGGTVDSLSARTDLGPEAYATHALTWIEMGASIVGGCCEVGPDHIRVLHDQLLANGYELNHSLAA